MAALNTPSTSAPEKTRQPGPPLWLSILVFLIGTGLIAFGAFVLLSRFLESSTVPSFEVPGSQERSLDPGTYDVFGSTGDVFDFFVPPSFSAAEVTVTNTDTGVSVPTNPGAEVEFTITRQTTSYERVGTFTITEAGSYRFDITPQDGADPSRAVVARSVFATFGEARSPIIILGVGIVLTVLGAIMVIIGIVRRGRAKRAAKGHGPTPGIYQAPLPATSTTTPAAPQNPAAPLSPTPPPAPPPTPPGSSNPGETNTPW